VLALILNLVLSVWLLASAYVMPHNSVTAWNALIVAIVAAALSLLAFAAPGRPGLRHGTSVVAVWLIVEVMLLPHVALTTIFGEVLVAMGLAAIALLIPAASRHHDTSHPAPRAV
jgi:hypothetical protein